MVQNGVHQTILEFPNY